jgi:hypothetical protein
MPKATRVNITPQTTTPEIQQPNLRALTIFTRLPPGHATFRIVDDGSAPHLNENEFAVVDITDRGLQHGELFIIQYETGNRRRRVVQLRKSLAQITATGPKQVVWWAGDLSGFRQVGDCPAFGIRAFAGLSDGPYLAHHLQAKLVGRVVGVAATSLGNQIPEELGWQNEANGNADFDPAEYIDVLLASGHRCYLMRGRDGHTMYGESFPERALTDAEHARTMAVRWKYARASKASQLVKAECERRGLVEQ